MPWRLIGCIIILMVVLAFIGFNLDHRCSISFGPWGSLTVPDVPIYFTAFASFVLGMLCSLPLVISLRFKKPREEKGKRAPQQPAPAGEHKGPKDDGTYGID